MSNRIEKLLGSGGSTTAPQLTPEQKNICRETVLPLMGTVAGAVAEITLMTGLPKTAEQHYHQTVSTVLACISGLVMRGKLEVVSKE